MKVFKWALGLTVALQLVGCASVNMAEPQQDAAAKQFKVAANQAGVYIYRNEAFGAAVKMDVSINGQEVGQTVANTYIFKAVPPGKTVLSSKAENTDTLEIDTKPGALYYIWQEVKMGVLYARNKLHQVSEEQGRKGVNETKLIATK